MTRPVTLFTGQWADLSFPDLCKLAGEIGYDGLEIACWGDHIDPKRAADDPQYVDERKTILKDNGLDCWCLGSHIIGQCLGDRYEPRVDTFAPDHAKGDPEKIRAWAAAEMKTIAQAAVNMGVKVVTGFTGSPIWAYLYSFPPNTEEMITAGYQEIVELWSPVFDEFDRLGVRFALEVHPTEIAYDYYTTKRLLAEFDQRETLGINFDPSHLIWQGVTPHLFLRDFASRIYHVHMKDAGITLDGRSSILGSHLNFGDLRRGWDFRSLGHGDVDFDKIIRELNDMGYSGPLSVEWEDSGMERVFGAKESLEFVRRVNFQPSAIGFDDSMKK